MTSQGMSGIVRSKKNIIIVIPMTINSLVYKQIVEEKEKEDKCIDDIHKIGCQSSREPDLLSKKMTVQLEKEE